jgi:hypothetical protein
LLTLILTAWEFFVKDKICLGWIQQNIFLNIKNALQTFFSRGFHYKCHFQAAFDDNLSVAHVFIKQIFRAVEVAPPSPSPHRAVNRGWGNNGYFQPQAVALVMTMKK